jgi:hypothetical protein
MAEVLRAKLNSLNSLKPSRLRYSRRLQFELGINWKAEKIAGGYVVRDADGQSLAYVYSRATETDAMQAKVLTEDEARRVARLPELVGPKD